MAKRRAKRLDEAQPDNPKELLAEEERIFAAYKQRCPEHFLTFARGLTIAAGKGPAVFETVMAPFQREAFEAIAQSIHDLRDGDPPEFPRWWFERTKKASKDADLGLIILWLMCFPRRPFYAQVGAGDRDQAAIVKSRIEVLLHHNKWLNEYVEIVQWQIRSKTLMESGKPMAVLDIMAADIGGAHGGTPDLLVLNELSHVQKWEFIQNLMDNADGVPQGMVIAATNAGFKGSSAEVWRKNAISDTTGRWKVYVLTRPADWHNKQALEDAKAREVSKSRYNRLWWGKWASGKGDALDEDAVDRCFRDWSKPPEAPVTGYEYVCGLDIGVEKDHTGVVVLGVHREQRKIDLAYMRSWEPGPRGEVKLGDVRSELLRLHRIYRFRAMIYDPHQAKLLVQDLRPHMLTIKLPFTPKNCDTMASCLLQAVNNGILRLFDDEAGTMRRDLGKFDIVEKAYGVKLNAVSDEYGHADVGTALIIALPTAIELMDGTGVLMGDDVLVDLFDTDLTEEEVEEMPDELREIYEMGEEDELDAFYAGGGP